MGEDELHPFDPDWVLAPAALLRSWLKEQAMTEDELAVGCWPAADPDTAQRAIEAALAKEPLTEEYLAAIATGTRTSITTWRNAERIYREGLAAGKKDVTDG